MKKILHWDTKEKKDDRVYVLVIYDISSNKRRTKFAKKMNSYGIRVQRSAFEAIITRKKYEKLLNEIPRLINIKEDNVRVYKMVGYGEIKAFGNQSLLKKETVIIV